ncbi:hypothetical protein CR513_51693, partial [Mucuna pruriens]
MTRSSSASLYDLDPEIEITLRRLRKARSIVVSNSSNYVSSFDSSNPVTNTYNSVEYSSTNNFAESWLHQTWRTNLGASILFNTWGDMKRMFLEKFFPASRTATIKKEICGIRHILEKLYMNTRKDSTSFVLDVHVIRSTSLGFKTLAAARHLISNMTSNTQQFGIREPI